ncbi:MAG: hypothetical protein M3N51_08425 [Actinomycetota bacterium]|nr:hypothetical protein [Actinomycetota bacterium]
MPDVVIVVAIAVVVLAVVVSLLARVGRATQDMGQASGPSDAEPVRPRPRVAEFHVRGAEAQVFFEVPLGAGDVDEVLRDLLLHEAVEVVREKRHSLPIEGVGKVVAFGRQDGEFVQAGQMPLKQPGVLPPPEATSPLLRFGRLGYDPLEQQFASDQAGQAPGLAETAPRKELPAVGRELRIPKAIEAALRAQGIEPDRMSVGELAVGLLGLVGYMVSPGEKESTYFATKGGIRTYLRVVPHEPGEYQELDERVVDEFFVDFISSGADRGLLVSDKFGPFAIHARERREPRVRFVTRQRLQHFVDALALN